MLEVRFTILGDQVLARGFSRFGDKIQDFRPLWEDLKVDFHRIEDEQFDSQGARGGTPWAPLSPRYEAWKAKYFPGQPLLRLTGWMWGVFAVGTGMMYTTEPLRLKIEPPMSYAGIHQRGNPRGNLPRRPVVVMTEADKENWVKRIHNYIYDKAKEEHLL